MEKSYSIMVGGIYAKTPTGNLSIIKNGKTNALIYSQGGDSLILKIKPSLNNRMPELFVEEFNVSSPGAFLRDLKSILKVTLGDYPYVREYLGIRSVEDLLFFNGNLYMKAMAPSFQKIILN